VLVLNRNRQFTDVTQCKALTDEEFENAVPTSMLVDLEPRSDDQQGMQEWEMPMMASLWSDSVEDAANMDQQEE
jgi:hypothetical protein